MAYISTRNHYFSIPDIISSQERVPVTFQRSLPYLGVLDPSYEDTTLQAGTSLELPFWMTASLASEHGVGIGLPLVYGHDYRDILMADSNVVNLSKLCKSYFEFGKLLTHLRPADGKELSITLVQTFVDRFRQLFDWSQCATEAELETFDKLEALEMALLERAKAVNIELSKWMEKGVRLIDMADLVSNHKKRRFMAGELQRTMPYN